MYGYNVTNSSDESTKTTSTTNVSNIATANHAKTGNGYANIQYISYAYAENIKINGENLKDFNPETLEYTIEISKSMKQVEIEVTKGATYQTITSLTDFDIKEKLNTKYIKITAQDGTEVTYTIHVKVADSRLESLEIANASISPAFNSDTYEYNVTVDSEFDWIDIKGIPISDKTTVIGNGKRIIEVGKIDIAITTKNETGDSEKYILHISRKGSSYSYLKDILIDGTSLEGFDKDKYYYEIPVSLDTKSINLEGIKYRISQEVTLPDDLTINSGENRKEIVVVSEDKSKISTYVLNFIKEHSSKLKSLKFGNYSFKEEFDSYIYEYTLEVAKGTVALPSAYEAYDEEAHVKVTGNGYITENSTITVNVTEPHSQETTYKIKVTKEQSPDEEIKTDFKYTGDIQTFIAPYSGTYKLETWGAQGGTTQGYLGGFGAYSYGEVWLTKGEVLYIGVGGAGIGASRIGQTLAGGYNGGGSVTGRIEVNHFSGSRRRSNTHCTNYRSTINTFWKYRRYTNCCWWWRWWKKPSKPHICCEMGHGRPVVGGFIGGGATSNAGIFTASAGTQNSGFTFGKGGNGLGNAGGRWRFLWRTIRRCSFNRLLRKWVRRIRIHCKYKTKEQRNVWI